MKVSDTTVIDRAEPSVAIIGSACKFPGGSNTPEQFFQNLLSGRNYVSKIPMDRWSLDKFYNPEEATGKAYVQNGHFLHDYDYRGFDAEFFNFSPREVEFLDPQQRMLLELSWEAMESAGLNPEELAGSDTGVFVGGFTVDHLLNQFGIGAREAIGSHSAAGATLTMLSNRVSYAFDFRGPSFSVDTACSSSLVAFAQAVSAIKSNQCEAALVGGVNFMLRPEYTIAMSKGRFLAKDGRSKSFDARADGYGRGEGGGIVVLKSLAAAERDGDPILAVVAGVGVNQDGRTSGITVPNPQAQRELMTKVLTESCRTPDEISYVEAHGTGTAVGDPLETKAISEVYGQHRNCQVGSVKASIGHLEAAAGMASVIKSVMMFQYNTIPPVAGLKEVNPAIPATVSLTREPIPLESGNKPALIAINSFGYGGTNAHLILGAPSADSLNLQPAEPRTQSGRMLPVSARDSDALRARALQFLNLLESEAICLDEVLYTAGNRRAHLSHRLALWGDSKEALQTALRQHLDGETPAGCAQGERNGKGDTKVVFIYTGMGPQWHGMGCELFQSNEVFRNALLDADRVFKDIAGFSILEEMLKSEEHSEIKRTELAQPGNLMVQIGLTAVLRAEGVHPAAVVGHSVGEVASAWASGMLTLEDALRVSYQRSRIQATTAGEGKMLALGVSEAEAAELIAPYAGEVSLAAINSPSSVTVAGDAASLDAICTLATERKLFARMLDVEVPYHSPVMEKLKPELRAQLASLKPVAPITPLYSTVTGARTGHQSDTRFYDAEYWCDNVRDPVHFATAVRSLLGDGYTLFVEVGPHPVLRRSIEEVVKEQGVSANVIATLWMNKPEQSAVQQAVADIYTSGGIVDWKQREPCGRLLQLPAYPWQRKALWRESLWQSKDRLESQIDPLCATQGADLNLNRLNYLFDHKVDGAAIMPAAGYLEALCQNARQRWPQTDEVSGWSLRNIGIHEALILDRERATLLQVEFDEFTNKAQLVAMNAQSDKAPVVHADAQMYPLTTKRPRQLGSDIIREFTGETVPVDALYEELRDVSLQYGPAFQSIVKLTRNRQRGEVLATLQRPDCAGEDTGAYILHPSLLDGCFQSALSLMETRDGAYLPVALDAIQVFDSAQERIVCYTRIVSKDPARIVCDFDLADEEGNVFAAIRGLSCVALRGKSDAGSFPKGDYQRVWNALQPLEKVDQNVGLLGVVANPADLLADALVEVCLSMNIPHQRFCMSEVRDNPALKKTTHLAVIADAGLRGESDPTGQDVVEDLLMTVQELDRHQQRCKLRVITRQAAAIGSDDQVIPAQTAVAGFMRVVRNECEQLDAALIDVAVEEELYLQAQCLFVELLNSETIDEIAIRNGQRYGVELVRSATLEQEQSMQVADIEQTPVLFRKKGTEYQALISSDNTTVAPNQYQIRLTRLAFKPGNEHVMGACGVIVQAGEDTALFKPGDTVCGILPQQLSTQVVVSEQQAILVKVANSSALSLQASVAVIEAQAAYIAQCCGELEAARVLTDNTALGEALGRHLARKGAEVVAFDQYDPASDHNFDLIAGPLALWSRSVGFSSLRRGGCLVDLSDAQTPFAIPPYCEQFIRVPQDMAGLQKSSQFRSVLAEVIEAAAEGMVPVRTEMTVQSFLEPNALLSTDEWQEITLHPQQTPFSAIIPEAPSFYKDGAYLVTGGFGGLGAELALWLADNGAGQIALVSRRGLASPDAEALIQKLKDKGADVSGYAVDMADAAAVHQLVKNLSQGERPLKGIFHAAGVLEDQLIKDMQQADIGKVMQVKAGGALAIHNGLQYMGVDVDHFVLFSSIANLVGNSRQANYCAANGFLDGLAHQRRALGLNALSVNFGAIAEVGMLDGDARVEQHLTQIGLAPLSVAIALRGVGRAMMQNQTQIAVAEKIAWERWAAYEVVGGESPAFRKLVAESREANSGDASLIEQLHRAILSLPEEEARQVLGSLIADVIAVALKTSADRLKADQAFDTFGVDSLMSTEIQIQLVQAIGINFSVVELLGHSTINSLVDKAMGEICNGLAN